MRKVDYQGGLQRASLGGATLLSDYGDQYGQGGLKPVNTMNAN